MPRGPVLRHDEADAVTSRTETSPSAAVRMNGIRVPTGSAEDIRCVDAGVSVEIDLLHARAIGTPGWCVHPLMTVHGSIE